MFIKIEASLFLPLPIWRVAERDSFSLCLSQCNAVHTASAWDDLGTKIQFMYYQNSLWVGKVERSSEARDVWNSFVLKLSLEEH